MAEASAANHRDRRHSQTPAESQQRVFLRAMLVRSTSARHRIRYGIRHTAARAGVSQTVVCDTSERHHGFTTETVVVGSRGQPRTVTTSPVPVDVLSPADLTSQGTINLQDLPE